MAQITTHVRQATSDDGPRMLSLLDQAVRQYISFGREDLSYLLTRQSAWVADAGGTLWGFVFITPRSTTVSDLRALALVNGWRVDTGVQTLLEPVTVELEERGLRTLLCFGAAPWLVPPLQRAGFTVNDRIVYFERFALQPTPEHPTPGSLRPVRRGDLPTLLSLDGAAFEDIWRFDRGHFMEMLVTCGRSILAQSDGQAVGYAICDVLGDTGFIVRIAVHPRFGGQGFGSQMLGDCLDYCRSEGASFVRLNTQESNVASHRLYESFDFHRVGRRVPVMVKKL